MTRGPISVINHRQEQFIIDSNGDTLEINDDGSINVKFSPAFSTRSETFTTTGNGTTIDVSSTPLQTFTLQVVGTNGTPVLWSVLLEGSLDGTNFTTILRSTDALGNGTALFSGGSLYPVLYYRIRCASLTLGLATNIVAKALGV